MTWAARFFLPPPTSAGLLPAVVEGSGAMGRDSSRWSGERLCSPVLANAPPGLLRRSAPSAAPVSSAGTSAGCFWPVSCGFEVCFLVILAVPEGVRRAPLLGGHRRERDPLCGAGRGHWAVWPPWELSQRCQGPWGCRGQSSPWLQQLCGPLNNGLTV